MRRARYPLRRYPLYRTELNAGQASVGISELKANPIKYIYAAEARPIKILRYGHLAALIITPEHYDRLSKDLQKARTEAASLRNLLKTISPDLVTFWEQFPPDLSGLTMDYARIAPTKLPKLAEDYVKKVEEVLDDLINESDLPKPVLDKNLEELFRWFARGRGQT